MNEQKARKLIAEIDECNWMRMSDESIVLDGTFTPLQIEAIGWWFQRNSKWP